MNSFDTVAKKAEVLKNYLVKCTEGYVETNHEFEVHKKQLEEFLPKVKSDEESAIFYEMIEFLEKNQREYSQAVKEVDDLIEILQFVTAWEKETEIGKKKCNTGLEILDVQEKERDRIARELHDSTVQDLTALIYKVELCSKFLDKDPTKVRLELQLIICSLKKVIEEMRSVIHDLKPMELEEKSLNDSIKKYISSVAITYTDMSFKYKLVGQERSLDSICELTLLRIVQEACQNAIKHARAKCIQVELCFYSNKVCLSIKDNGIGFDMKEVASNKEAGEHFGLVIMKERARLMDAKLDINSTKKKGTSVNVEVINVYSDEGDSDGAD